MALKRIVMLLVILPAMIGCTISRNIVDLQPVQQPTLQELEQRLDYTDPDNGRPDYIITP